MGGAHGGEAARLPRAGACVSQDARSRVWSSRIDNRGFDGRSHSNEPSLMRKLVRDECTSSAKFLKAEKSREVGSEGN
jgi:hypothetical protein